MKTHQAVATTALRAPLEIISVPTWPPEHGEVLIKNEYVDASPLELHQSDGGLLVKHPQVLGDAFAGMVLELGNGVTEFQVGDKVFGFAFDSEKQKIWQAFLTVPVDSMGKIPGNTTPQQAVTMPTNLVTAFHTLRNDLFLTFP